MLILIFFLLLSLWGFYFAIRPLRIITLVTPKQFDLNYDTVTFRTKDHVLIKGWFIPNKNPRAKTIILLHGYPADKGDLLASRLFLHQDYHLLLIDFRYLGESEGSYSTAGFKEVKDLKAAIKWLHSRGIHELGIWGISMGAAVALMAAPSSKEIKAVVAESSYARLDMMAAQYFTIPLLRYPLGQLMRLWGWLFLGYDAKKVSPMDAAAQLTIPVLLIHSQTDALIPFSQAKLIQAALRNNPHAEFLFFADEPHGGLPPDYQSKIKAFFARSL